MKIKDFKSIKENEKLVVLPLHRNVLDIPLDKYKYNTSYRPETFFKSEKDILIYKGDLKVKSKEYNSKEDLAWSLHIEYKKDNWYPLDNNGYLPSKSVDTGNKLLGKKTHWNNFNVSTHLGWRDL